MAIIGLASWATDRVFWRVAYLVVISWFRCLYCLTRCPTPYVSVQGCLEFVDFVQ